MAEHTSLPWQSSDEPDGLGEYPIHDATWKYIASTINEDVGNTIVRAVNHYEELVDTLRFIVGQADEREEYYGDPLTDTEPERVARHLLAKIDAQDHL